MKLIGSLASPFVRKVRITLIEKKIECPFETEDVWQQEATVCALNPLGKVPYLLLENEDVLFDSSVICEYLDTLTPIGQLIPQINRIEIRRFEALADGILDALVLIRLEETLRAKELRSEQVINRQLSKVKLGLDLLAQHLADKQWCVGTQFTLADITIGCVFGYLDFRFPTFSHLDWQKQYPALLKYYETLNARPSFANTLPQ